MRGQRVEIKGINRQVGSPDNDTGFCSELINIRPQNGLKVMGKRLVRSANIPYTRIKIHKIGNITNYIGVQDDATRVKIVHFNPTTGAAVQNIATFSAGSEVYFALVDNQIVISDKTAIKRYMFRYDGIYKNLYNGVAPRFPYGVLSTQLSPSPDDTTVDLMANSKEEYVAGLQAQINKFEQDNKFAAEGCFLYALTVTYYDGTEDRTFGPTFVNASRNTPISSDFITVTGSTTGGTSKSIKTKFTWKGYYKQHLFSSSKNTVLYNNYKDLIKSINLYVSKPISKYAIDKDKIRTSGMGWDDNEVTTLVTVYVPQVDIKDSGIEKTLLYKQKSWTLGEFCNGVNQYKIEFGGDKQTTGATMEVYGSDIERAGKMFTYNKKIHFFDTRVRLNMNVDSILYTPYSVIQNDGFSSVLYANATVLLHIKAYNDRLAYKFENKDVVLAKTSEDAEYKLILPEISIFEDSRVEKVDVIITSMKDSTSPSLVDKKFVISTEPSPVYNFSFSFGGALHPVPSIETFDGTYPTLSDTYVETDAINVTATGNPIVFPVSYSYKFDGNITALAVAMEAISATQVGQYPLYVFTDSGIYALEQGNGAVLYSNIVPVSGDNCYNPNVVYTRQGIAYTANGSVYILNGRTANKLSLLIEGKPDTYIQNNASFAKCCANSLYNITNLLSKVDFREYIKDATLSWCANTNELIVSSKSYPFSYVFDFVFNSWYKVEGMYEMIEDNMVLTPISINNNGATPATSVLTLHTLHKESTRSFSSLSQADFTSLTNFMPGHTYALVVDETQVASVTFTTSIPRDLGLSLLCDKVSYLEDKSGIIYSSINLAGKAVKVFDITTNTNALSTAFTANATTVSIPDKGIGEKISLQIGNEAYNAVVSSSDSVVTILNFIADSINNNSKIVTAQVSNNTIVITTKDKGATANNNSISITSTNTYANVSVTPFTGGQDISLTPSQYRQMVDWSNDDNTSSQTVHLHTRPLFLGDKNTYKVIKDAVLNCLADLKGDNNLSLYIYGSNNLIDWKCICAAQRQNCEIAQMHTDRSAKAYKYFVFMIGGKVNVNTQISDIILSIDDIANNKVR